MTVWLHTHLPRLKAGEPDCISVKVPGERVAYASWVLLGPSEFRVHERGRQRCLEFGVRNVHAWVVGEEWDRGTGAVPWAVSASYWSRAVYDPWRGGAFVDLGTKVAVFEAERVLMVGKDVFYRPVVL